MTDLSKARGIGSKGTVYLVAGILFYVLMQAFFFPSHYAADDEGCYVSMAHVFARGRLSGEGFQDEMNLYRFYPRDGRLVGAYDAGTSFLMVPFTWFGSRGVFLLNMLMFMLGFVIFFLLLRRLQFHPAFSLLYLLYPTLWNDSRNIRSGFPAGVLFLAGFYCFLAGGRAVLLAGFLMGLAVFARPTTSLLVAGLLAAWFIRGVFMKPADRKGTDGYQDMGKRVALLALGAAIPLGILLAYNCFILHSPTGFMPERVFAGCRWSPLFLLDNIVHYGLSQNVLYPLMLILFFFYRGPLRWPMFGAVILGGGFYLLYNAWGFPEEPWAPGRAPFRFLEAGFYVLGPIYWEPVQGLLLIGYACVLNWFAVRFNRLFWVPYAVGIVVISACDVGMTVVHQRGMDQAAYFRDQLFDHTPKGSLVLMDHYTRTYISSDVPRPRRLVWAFPFGCGFDNMTVAKIDDLIRREGDAYVTRLDIGRKDWAETGPDRQKVLDRWPHEKVVDAEKNGWRLEVFRLKAEGR